MIKILPISMVHVAASLTVAAALLSGGCPALGCETAPDLHIEVTAEFETAPVRNDYTLADIATLARQQHRDSGRALLGFYASEFGYTLEFAPNGDRDCPSRIEVLVTMRLQHRLIEIGQEAAASSCAYPGALQHYRRLAQVDEQTVQSFAARAATTLAQAAPALKETHATRPEELDTALQDRIRAIVDAAIAPLHDARLDAQNAVNSSEVLGQLASSCSI